jgi:pimeloyl-ACP methyl ester carboxylesterase
LALLFALGRPVAWTEAALVVFDVAGGGPWHWLTDTPVERPATWPRGEGDLYTPAARVRAALVLVPGAAALGRDEPRLRALARTLARAGFAVLVPELPEVRRFALSRRDADRVADALRHLRTTYADAPLGVMAISYGVAPALIAATQDDLAPGLAFAVGIGGYRDTEAAIRFVTTGAFRVRGDGREHRVAPNLYGRWTFVLANAGRLEDAADSADLTEIALRRWGDPTADIADLAGKLGPQGRAVLALADNRDPDAVVRLIEALPEPVRREIDGLNLALYDLGKLRGHLILLHGQDDRLVPYGESEMLAAAASNARASLFLIDGIGHVEFNAVTVGNAWKMWQAVLALLDERRLGAPSVMLGIIPSPISAPSQARCGGF